MSFFNTKFTDWLETQIPSHLSGPIQAFLCYNRLKDVLTVNELRETEQNILLLTLYLVKNNKFIFPSAKNSGKIYRAGKLNSGDATNEYFPISKSAATSCPTPSTSQEPIWFGLEPHLRYLNLSPAERFGLVTCKQIKNIGNDIAQGRQGEKKFNLVVNLSTDNLVMSEGNPAYLLSKSLQVAINKAILIPIARGFCEAYSKTNYSRDLTYDYILRNAASFEFRNGTVRGYNCEGRYTGGTIESLLKCWDYNTGTRFSIYNEDRIQIQVLFEVFEWVEQIINSVSEPFNRDFINWLRPQYSDITYTTKFNLIGWFCKDTPRGRDGSLFPGEFAISIKYFAAPLRYEIFNRQQEDCKPQFYVYDAQRNYRETPGPAQDAPQPRVQQNPFGFGFIQAAQPRVQQHNPFRRGGFKKLEDDDNKEYYYSKKPERQDSDDLFQVFFANNPKEEEKYTDEPKEIAEIIKKYVEDNTKSNPYKISSTIRPQSIRTGKLLKKHKQKSLKKKISKKYKKKELEKIRKGVLNTILSPRNRQDFNLKDKIYI